MDSVSADQKGPDLVDAKYVDINGFQFMREMEFVNFYSDDEDNGGEISFELNLENVCQAPLLVDGVDILESESEEDFCSDDAKSRQRRVKYKKINALKQHHPDTHFDRPDCEGVCRRKCHWNFTIDEIKSVRHRWWKLPVSEVEAFRHQIRNSRTQGVACVIDGKLCCSRCADFITCQTNCLYHSDVPVEVRCNRATRFLEARAWLLQFASWYEHQPDSDKIVIPLPSKKAVWEIYKDEMRASGKSPLTLHRFLVVWR